MTYTPTTESVRQHYLELSESVSGSQEIAQGNVEYFDRWYAEEIRKAKEDAWDEGHYWGRQYHAQALNGEIPTSNPHREEA